jgi:hypothetical protein
MPMTADTLWFEPGQLDSVPTKAGVFARLKEPKSKSDLMEAMVPVFECMNVAYKNLYGFNPLSLDEMKHLTKKYLPVLEPSLIKYYEMEGKVVGFIIAMPDPTSGLIRAKGRLFPIGWWHIWRALKTSPVLQMLLIGVHPQLGSAAIMKGLLGSLNRSVLKMNRFKILDSHLNLESNKPIRRWLERLGGRVHKIYRLYGKTL